MPVIYEINKAQRMIRTRCVGDTTLDEVLGHFRTLERDPGCPTRLNALLDLCEVTSAPNPFELRLVSAEMARVQKKVRFEACAIVAPQDLIYGMMRMYVIFAAEYFGPTHVFRTRPPAEQWLAARPLPCRD